MLPLLDEAAGETAASTRRRRAGAEPSRVGGPTWGRARGRRTAGSRTTPTGGRGSFGLWIECRGGVPEVAPMLCPERPRPSVTNRRRLSRPIFNARKRSQSGPSLTPTSEPRRCKRRLLRSGNIRPAARTGARAKRSQSPAASEANPPRPSEANPRRADPGRALVRCGASLCRDGRRDVRPRTASDLIIQRAPDIIRNRDAPAFSRIRGGVRGPSPPPRAADRPSLLGRGEGPDSGPLPLRRLRGRGFSGSVSVVDRVAL